MHSDDTHHPLIFSGPPGSGRSFAARANAPSDALWIDASAASSSSELEQLVAHELERAPARSSERHVVLDDVRHGVDADALCARWPCVRWIVTTIARSTRDLEPLDDAGARALFERASEVPATPTSLGALRGRPGAIVTASRRAHLVPESMLEQPWGAWLWDERSPLRDSYERAWRALHEDERALIRACVLLAESSSAATLWAWNDYTPACLDALHATHWFERPWSVEEGARAFVLETVELEGARGALSRWLFGHARDLAMRFKQRGEREAKRGFTALWPLIERALDGGWFSSAEVSELLVVARASIILSSSFARFDAYVVEAMRGEVAEDDALLLEAFHEVYIGDRGQRASALARLADLAPGAQRLEASWKRAQFANLHGTLLAQSGDARGLSILERSYEDARSCGDHASAMHQKIGLTRLSLHGHRPEAARVHAMAALSLAEHDDLGLFVPICQGWLGTVLNNLWELEPAIGYLRMAIDGLGEDEVRFRAMCMGNLSISLIAMRRLDEALDVLTEVWDVMGAHGAVFSAPTAMVCIALCHYGLRRFESATEWLERALVALETLPLSAAHFEAHALKAADCIRTGADPSHWFARCEANVKGSLHVSHAALEALGSGSSYSPQNAWEEILWVDLERGVILDVSTRTMRIGVVTYDFARRNAAWSLLVALARADGPIDAWSLVEIGWPGMPLRDEILSRLYVTIRRLRTMGLEGWLRTTGDGYELSDRVRIVGDEEG